MANANTPRRLPVGAEALTGGGVHFRVWYGSHLHDGLWSRFRSDPRRPPEKHDEEGTGRAIPFV